MLLRNRWQGLQALQAPGNQTGCCSRSQAASMLNAGETLIPVQLTTAVKGCGRALDPSSDHEDLREGTAVELPLWLLPRFTCENWARVKCVGLAAVISLWPSCSGHACSARAGPPQTRAVCGVCNCCSSLRAGTECRSKCVRPPPKHQLPA